MCLDVHKNTLCAAMWPLKWKGRLMKSAYPGQDLPEGPVKNWTLSRTSHSWEKQLLKAREEKRHLKWETDDATAFLQSKWWLNRWQQSWMIRHNSTFVRKTDKERPGKGSWLRSLVSSGRAAWIALRLYNGLQANMKNKRLI